VTLRFRHSPNLADLLAEAGRAYRRHDDQAFRLAMKKAATAAPERLDLQHAVASHHIQSGRPDLALAVFKRLDRLIADDAETLFHLAYWSRFAGEEETAAAAEERLLSLRPEQAAELSRIRLCLEAWLRRPLESSPPLPPPPGVRAAIVVFGYRLEADGGIHPFLEARLEKALRAAARLPTAVIVATGGVPRAGWAEAAAMRRWLTARGVAEERVLEEGYARDLAENVVYSRQILARLGIVDVVCIVSAIAARRAGAGMEISGWSRGRPWRQVTAAASDESLAAFVDDGRDRLKLFRDALRVYGIPMMRVYPELAER
jgi:tetratricopeptide (TPR) repeat protein